MSLCGLHLYQNSSEKGTLQQGLNAVHNVSEDFPFLDAEKLETHILAGFIILISVFGMLGNGVVLWYLCFFPKSNSFIFITNLAIADFGILFVLFAYLSLFFAVYLYGHSYGAICVLNLGLSASYLVLFCASALFLAAVSADRCVAVFFPHWHRCRRPKSLPTIVSALLWPLAFVAGGLTFYFDVWLFDNTTEIIIFILIDAFTVLSLLALSIRVYCCLRLLQRGRLLKVIMFSLTVFVMTLVPQTFFLLFISDIKKAYLFKDLLTALNSSANPVIYFFVGRLRGVPTRKSVGVVLQKVFREEEGYEGQPSGSKSSDQTTY